MRLFIAIELSEQLKKNIAKFSERINYLKSVKVPSIDSIHLTLLFLGDKYMPEEVIEKLSTIRFKKFTLKIEGFGFFSKQHKIKVGWLGIQYNISLMNLQKQIANVFNDEKEYVPHITVARVSNLSKEERIKFLEAIFVLAQKECEFEVERIKLFSSKLTPLGPVYRVLNSYSATV